MAPGVREVDVNTNHEVKTYLKRRSNHALNFVKQLYDIAKTTTVLTDGSESLITYMDLSLVCNLARVNMHIDKEWDMVAPLIRRNAQTLTHITVITNNVGAITGLVRDSNGGLSTEYPCLHTLSVHLVVDPTESQRLTINEAVPFPRLRYLNLTGYYPFGDDLPFRGNAASLESLVLGLSQALVTVLVKHNVFTAVSHPKIQCVRMKYEYCQFPDELSTATSCMQFVLGIAPGAPVRVLPNMSKYEDGLASALSMLSRHTNLQVLDLYGAHILFWDAISLIRSLPLLSDLTTIPMHINELPKGITLAELPAYMCSTYAPMSERFRFWHAGYNEICYPTTHARCMLLIALVCPNFTYATPPLPYTSGRLSFMKRMKEEIASDMFKPYVPRLRHLLFNGWSKC
ncbi:hypothetical protein GGI24_003562 [Coemansia furcata]|nr:hypothetical protein GGI24_003562 [Coemansia furcata]